MTNFCDEQVIEADRFDSKCSFSGLSRTIEVVYPDKESASRGSCRLQEAWRVIGSWGRWCDEEIGEWPSNEHCISALPDWLQKTMSVLPAYEIDNWLSDLHDRSWVIWSTSRHGASMEILLACESMPISDWTLKMLIEQTGGTIKN